MGKILKYLKPYKVLVFSVVVLLLVQAFSDLALPGRMSNIVNIGISANGIENTTPEILTEQNFLSIITLIENDNDRKFVEESYIKIETTEIENYSNILEKFPESKNNTVYILNTTDKKNVSKLDEILIAPEALLLKLKREGVNIGEVSPEDIKKTIENSKIDVTTMEMIMKETAISFIKEEYKSLGRDMDNMQLNYIVKSGAVMLGYALLGMICIILSSLLSARIAAAVGRDLRGNIYNKIISFSNEDFNKFSAASLITRTTNDIQQVQMAMYMMLRMVVIAPILGVGGVIKALSIKAGMSQIIFIAILVIMFMVALLFKIAVPRFTKIQKIIDKVNLLIRENLSGMMVIRAFNTQKYEEKRFDETNKELTENDTAISKLMSTAGPIIGFIMNMTSISILWIGAKKVNINVIEIGDMVAFIQYSMTIIMAFLAISMLMVMIPRASVSANRIVEVLDAKSSIIDPDEEKKFLSNKKGNIKFKNVGFKYEGADEYVLQNINLEVKSGETVAFIGSTGSGKSTLINLLPRFYDVTEGEILLNDVNIKDINQKTLRDSIGYVPQKAFLFSGTIESNIKAQNENITDKEMIEASKIAQAYDFIMDREQQFQDPITQGGTNVSGGQRQRISIARAIAKKGEVLIFDDSFSALDYATDKKLRQSIKDELNETSIIIVAQRISTIKEADNIIVLDKGKIIANGTHKWLLNNCDIYEEIASSQLSKEEIENERR